MVYSYIYTYNIDTTYFKTSTGNNCPLGHVIVAVDDCKHAANRLGMNYDFATSSRSFPAGCFFDTTFIYFNSEINPSNTDPSFTYGAICTRGMIALIKYFVLNDYSTYTTYFVFALIFGIFLLIPKYLQME